MKTVKLVKLTTTALAQVASHTQTIGMEKEKEETAMLGMNLKNTLDTSKISSIELWEMVAWTQLP